MAGRGRGLFAPGAVGIELRFSIMVTVLLADTAASLPMKASKTQPNTDLCTGLKRFACSWAVPQASWIRFLRSPRVCTGVLTDDSSAKPWREKKLSWEE